MKNIRVVLFENGTESAKRYVDTIASSINDEVVFVNVYDNRPTTQLIPVRAIPNVGILFLADTLEEGQQAINILKQLDYFKKQDAVTQVVDELNEVATPLTPELEEKVAATFYGG